MPALQIERRSRYGNQCWLPVNAAAKCIADIAGTVEVRPKDLAIAMKLGYSVVRVERRSDGSLLDLGTLSSSELRP